MRLIVITHPDYFPGEAAYINALFAGGMDCLHVRKPGSSAESMRSFLDQIAPMYRSRLALHQHHELAGKYMIRILHFQEYLRLQTGSSELSELINQGFLLSTSIHRPDAAVGLEAHFNYAFLAPVFDSISKPGHKRRLPSDFRIDPEKIQLPLIALGGITAERIPDVAEMGFAGAAVLGTLWGNELQLSTVGHRTSENPGWSSETFIRLQQAVKNQTECDRETSIHI